MTKLIQITVIAIFVTACAGVGGGSLPDGNYQLYGLNAKGEKIEDRIYNLDVPFNDQSFIIGAVCINPETKMVLIERNGEFVSKRQCIRR